MYKNTHLGMNFIPSQGDQIGQILAYWAIVFFG
jgi:hypothetical protein